MSHIFKIVSKTENGHSVRFTKADTLQEAIKDRTECIMSVQHSLRSSVEWEEEDGTECKYCGLKQAPRDI